MIGRRIVRFFSKISQRRADDLALESEKLIDMRMSTLPTLALVKTRAVADENQRVAAELLSALIAGPKSGNDNGPVSN